MRQAQDLLVELGECFYSATEHPLTPVHEPFAAAALPVLVALGRSGEEITQDIAHILGSSKDANDAAGHLERAASQRGASMTPDDLPYILTEFCVAYMLASKHESDIPNTANLQTTTRVLLEALAGTPALPEHVEDVFPFETCLSDA